MRAAFNSLVHLEILITMTIRESGDTDPNISQGLAGRIESSLSEEYYTSDQDGHSNGEIEEDYRCL